MSKLVTAVGETVAKVDAPFKAYCFNEANEIVIGYDVESMAQARKDAENWNRRHRRDAGRMVAFIGNAPEPKGCTRFTVVG